MSREEIETFAATLHVIILGSAVLRLAKNRKFEKHSVSKEKLKLPFGWIGCPLRSQYLYSLVGVSWIPGARRCHGAGFTQLVLRNEVKIKARSASGKAGVRISEHLLNAICSWEERNLQNVILQRDAVFLILILKYMACIFMSKKDNHFIAKLRRAWSKNVYLNSWPKTNESLNYTGLSKSSIPRLRDPASGRGGEFTQPWNPTFVKPYPAHY